MNSDKKFHILFASRLVWEKGADILVEVLGKTLTSDEFSDKIIWHICADGPYKSDILSLQKEYPDNIFYHGNVTQETLAGLYRQADLLYMPSRFLETFGLTALESLACGTPVCGFQKGGVGVFIDDKLAVDYNHPVESTLDILSVCIQNPELLKQHLVIIEDYQSQKWKEHLFSIFPKNQSILLLHDYFDRIGGAEQYVHQVEKIFGENGYRVSRFGYTGKTSVWKRRFLFMISLLAFWRGISLRKYLNEKKPDVIWMHSVLRYVGYWGILALNRYIQKRKGQVSVFLSHHDVGLLAPFPQDIIRESQIPHSTDIRAFIDGIHGVKRITASIKWIYLRLLKSAFPEMRHIIFAPFLITSIKAHFPGQEIIVLPHTFDENIFHP